MSTGSAGGSAMVEKLAGCNGARYNPRVIRSFHHKGLQTYFLRGSKAGIQPKHAARLRLQLGSLNRAKGPNDMNAPGWRLHALSGSLKGYWAVWVDENWRLTFGFDRGDAVEVDYRDYH